MKLSNAEFVERINGAYERTLEFVTRESWHLMKDYDQHHKTNSGIGRKYLPLRVGGNIDVSRGPNENNLRDAANGVIGGLKMQISDIYIEDNTDIIAHLAEVRISYMDYTNYSKKKKQDDSFVDCTKNHSQKMMLSRIFFDKFVEEIGGEDLVKEVLDKVAEMLLGKELTEPHNFASR